MANIYLTGFMGTGKSTVASALSGVLGIPVIDMDKALTKDFGMPISEVFKEKGEGVFRSAEKELLRKLSNSSESLIVSCGGGVVKDEENIDIMKGSGTVILLTASPDTLFERLRDDNERPLLKGRLSARGISEMLKERQMMYERSADLLIKTDGREPIDIARSIAIDVSRITML